MNNPLPKNIEDVIKDWFDGYEFEIIHFWNDGKFYQIVLITTDNILTCLRVWESSFSDKVQLSVDKSYELE